MRKSIFFSLLCLIAIVAVACGGGNNATGNGTGGGDAACGGGNGGGDASDPFALYKKEGRKWKTKSVTKIEGMDDMVSFTEYEVTKVSDAEATYVMRTLDKDGKETSKMEQTIKFETPKAETTGGEAAPEPTKETVTVAAGEFECYVNDTAGTKSWSSVKYPGLSVKMEGATMTMELVEFTE